MIKMLQTNFSELKISEKEQKYANLNRKLNELEKRKSN